MSLQIMVFLLVFLYPVLKIHPQSRDRLIVWSVGQGQMVTYSTLRECVHFDMGGEKLPLRRFLKECAGKKNKVFFSHWDTDHINWTGPLLKRLNSFCRLNGPDPQTPSRKRKLLLKVRPCPEGSPVFEELAFDPGRNKDKRATLANKYSRVVVVKKKVLIPGDSPGSSEPLWGSLIKDPVEVLIVGHHGSRFSTTSRLLKNLPHLKLAIASARRKRYGHPHPHVKARLKKRGVPLLSTEDFHHIIIPLPSDP